MSILKCHEGMIANVPDRIDLLLNDELGELIAASAEPHLNLSVRNYEWAVSYAFDTLRVDNDQSFKQADFVVTTVNTLFPNIKLLESFGKYDEISSMLDRTIRSLHDRLIGERLYYNRRFPYTPQTFITPAHIVFDYTPDGLPFSFKGINIVNRSGC